MRDGRPGYEGDVGIDKKPPRQSPSRSGRKGATEAEPASGAIPLIYGTRWTAGQIIYRGGSGGTGIGFIYEATADQPKFIERSVVTVGAEALAFCEGHPDIEMGGFIFRESLISGVTLVENGKTLPTGLNVLCAVGGQWGGPVPPGLYAGGATFYPDGNGEGEFSGNIATTWKGTALLEATGLIICRSDETSKGQPDLLFEIKGIGRESGNLAPAANVAENIWARAGMDMALLDVTEYGPYCEDNGFEVARIVDEASDAFSLMQTLVEETNSAFVWTNGKLKIVPLVTSGTQTATSLTEADFMQGDGISVERVPVQRCFTVFPVEFLRADSLQGDTPDSATNDAVALDTEVDRRAPAMQASWVATKDHADRLSFLLAFRSFKVRNLFTFTLNPRWSRLECGDYVSLTESHLGLDAQAARIVSIEDRADGWLTVTAEEYLGVTAPTPPVWTPEGGGGTGAPTQPPVDQGSIEADISAIEARLADMALDSRLVATERRQVFGLLDPLFREHNDLMQRAIAFTTSRIDPASYNDAVARLWAYCVASPPASGSAASGLSETTTFTNGLGLTGAAGGWPDGNAGHSTGTPPTLTHWTSWFSSGDSNGTIIVHGETFRDVVADALMERQLLLNAMTGSLRSSVDAITETIGQTADDGYLSYNEKRSMFIIYRGWVDEQTSLDAQALAQNLADTGPGDVVYDYDAAIDALKAYWTAAIPTDNDPALADSGDGLGLAAAIPSDAQVHTWMTATPNIAIHPATFRSKHLDVIAARTELLVSLQSDTHERVVEAIARIGAFASDGKVSVNEKPTVFREYTALCFESVSLNLEAGQANIAATVSSAHESYKTALWDLQTYMSGLGCPPAPGASPTINQPADGNLGTWLAATTSPNDAFHDCAVVRSTFTGKFSTVYTTRAALRRAISDAHAAALASLDRIRADGWLSAGEKRAVLDQYVGVVNQVSALTTQATSQGVTTHLTSYSNAIAALIAYVKASIPGLGVTPDATHGLGMTVVAASGIPTDAEQAAWVALTSPNAPSGSGDLELHPATFRAKFANCYSTQAQLVAELARDAWATADGAMARLTNLASDGVITSGEKDSIFREYRELLDERASLDYRADNAAFAGVTAVQAAQDAYDQATWRLQRYFYVTLGCPPDAPSATDASPWTLSTPTDANRVTWKASGAANGIAGDTAVTQSVLLSTFSAVYASRTGLERAIQDAAQAATSGAYALALGRNRYGTRAQRLATVTGLATGDNWFESDYQYKCWVWTGSGWVDSLSSVSTLGVETLYVANLTERDALTGLSVGDLCFVSGLNNACYRWSGSAWVSTTPAAPSVPTILSGTTAPSNPKVGDVWWDTTGGANIPKRCTSVGPPVVWQDLSQPADVASYGPQTTAPSNPAVGSIWYDSNATPPLTKRWSGSGWATIAGNSVTTSNVAPSSPIAGDVWVDTTGGGNVFKVWSGSGWVVQGSGNVISTQGTAPANPRTGDLWYDNSATPTVLKVWGGSAWSPLVGTGLLTAAMMATGTLSAGNITAGTLQAGVAYVGDLAAGQIKTGSLDAARVTAANLTSGSINATSMTVTGLNAGSITAGELAAARVTAANLTSGTIDATNMTVSNIAAGAIRAGSLRSDVVYTGNLTASQINAGTLDVARLGTGTLSANSAVFASPMATAQAALDAAEAARASAEAYTVEYANNRTAQIGGDIRTDFGGAPGATTIAGNRIASDSIASNDYTYHYEAGHAGDPAYEVADQGARIRNAANTGAALPAIIASPAGIKIGRRTVSESWLSRASIYPMRVSHTAGSGTATATGPASSYVVAWLMNAYTLRLGFEYDQAYTRAGQLYMVMGTANATSAPVGVYHAGQASSSVIAYSSRNCVDIVFLPIGGGAGYVNDITTPSWALDVIVVPWGSAF